MAVPALDIAADMDSIAGLVATFLTPWSAKRIRTDVRAGVILSKLPQILQQIKGKIDVALEAGTTSRDLRGDILKGCQ